MNAEQWQSWKDSVAVTASGLAENLLAVLEPQDELEGTAEDILDSLQRLDRDSQEAVEETER